MQVLKAVLAATEHYSLIAQVDGDA